jgi:hypothetical protein
MIAPAYPGKHPAMRAAIPIPSNIKDDLAAFP